MGLMKKTCPICGNEFETTYSRKTYCSQWCKNQNAIQVHRAKLVEEFGEATDVVNCAICGKKFKRNTAKQKYCSDECKKEAIRRRDRERRGYAPVVRKSKDDRCRCKRVRTCKYGERSTEVCMYFFRTGELRGGYPDECTHYERNSSGRRKENNE